MNKISLIIQYDTGAHIYPLRQAIEAYINKDHAIIRCAELMQTKNKPGLLSFYIEEIPIFGIEVENNTIDSFEFERNGGEIKVIDPEGREAFVDVVLTVDYANEPIAKKILSVKSIKICGSSIYDLDLSKEFIKKLEILADTYRLEMLEE